MGLNVAVLANLKENAPAWAGMPADAWAELDTPTTTDAIIAALQAAGHRATLLEGDLSLPDRLRALQPEICFNLCEGHWGASRESHVPALLEMLRLPYTGADVLGLALTLDKPMTKRVLAYHDLATPPFQVFQRADEPLEPGLRFPLFVKPSREGSSLGISGSSIVRTEAELRAQLKAQLRRFQQPILVEHYVRGREVTVGVLGNAGDDGAAPEGIGKRSSSAPGLRVLPPLEVHVTHYPGGEDGVYTGGIKSEPGEEYFFTCPAQLPDEQAARLQELAAEVFRVTGCRDVARVDFRLDADAAGTPCVLEVNALPGLCPGYSDLVLAAEAGGLDYAGLINAILDAACHRVGLAP